MIVYEIATKQDQSIPEEKAAIVARLDGMKCRDWAQVKAMGAAELDALEADIDSAVVIGLDYFHPHAQAIRDARKAVSKRRHAIKVEAMERDQRQRNRIDLIQQAENALQTAIEKLDAAYSIEPDPKYYAVPTLEPIDAATMTDEELTAVIRQCEQYATRRPIAAHDALAAIKTPAAKAIAAELKANAAAVETFKQAARANMDAAHAELARRDKLREEQAAREEAARADLLNEYIKLNARVAALESRA